ncbi:MAG: hypothetical protein JOZ90_16580 [Alphaproteobacteria bacterium]|nr:hypothetical protein [Alphaproteobacteria bacterium]MBV9371572.1 hypothetical protein [Alphaproteobacteria bacterium]MBV9902686.1 hypothetical protein [Alphaproteobacteria bacterium]
MLRFPILAAAMLATAAGAAERPAPAFPRLAAGIATPPADARVAGALTRSAGCLALSVETAAIRPRPAVPRRRGGGSTVVIWPHSPPAQAKRDGGGTTIIVWPRSAAARVKGGSGNVIIVWPREARVLSDGNGTTVVIWAFGLRIALRPGDRVEMAGSLVPDLAALPLDRRGGGACAGPALIATGLRRLGSAPRP